MTETTVIEITRQQPPAVIQVSAPATPDVVQMSQYPPGPRGMDGEPGVPGHSITVSTQSGPPSNPSMGDIWIVTT